jgi:3-phosphoinositide dependent protein kinase-1
VRDNSDGKEYAMKIISMKLVEREKKSETVRAEREGMNLCCHPNILRLIWVFQSATDIYHVFELAPNGSLQTVLDTIPRIDIQATRVASGQILLALAHMHRKRSLHRDLKPDCVLLGAENRVKITGFGSSKIVDATEPFCVEDGCSVGCADYASPETIFEQPAGPSSDLWSFACILFAMLAGSPPFHDESSFETLRRISELDYSVPDFVPSDARDLIQSILRLEPSERLGSGEHDSNYESLRNHPFYAGIDWEALPLTPMPPWQVPVQEPPPAPAAAAPVPAPGGISEVQALLPQGEVALIEGNVTKRRKLSRKHRRLALTSNARLVYFNMATKEMKGEIGLRAIREVTLRQGGKWAILIDGRTYDLTSRKGETSPQDWKTAIDGELAKLK